MALPKDINILLLGESGVGKTTFINSCYNYFTHPTLEHVLATKLEVVIPSMFKITDKYSIQKTVNIGNLSDRNECFEDASPATQNPKVYNFPVEIEGEKYRLRFLDTPGIGNPTNTDQDKLISERILNFVAELKEIHGFCLLLKPNCAIMNLFLNYVLTDFLSRLDASAVDNIIFVFTNSRGENFSAGQTLTPLKNFIQTVKMTNSVVIPLTKKNQFFFDNEWFRYAAAVENGVEMDQFVFLPTKLSWEKSSNELWRMIEYIVHIKPHNLQKTMLIIEARTIATLLSKPLCKILGVIQGNLRAMEVTRKELNDANLTREILNKEMLKPRTELRITRTAERQTVCTHWNCIDYHEVNGILEVHYRNPCCPNCSGPVNTCDIFNSKHPIKTFADSVVDFIPFRPLVRPLVNFLYDILIEKPHCCQCKHSYGFHQQIFYNTELVAKQVDESILTEINNQKTLAKAKEHFLEKLKNDKDEYEEERKLILETCAIINMFLKANSIAPTGDCIEYYFDYQKKACGSSETGQQCWEILSLYKDIKKELDNITTDNQISSNKIKEMKEKLFVMKNFGSTIKSMFFLSDEESKKDIKNSEIQVMTEYVKKMGN